MIKEKFILWFIIIPIFLLGLHLGDVITHISLGFSFEFPIFIRITGILTSIWVLLGVCLHVFGLDKEL